MFIQIFILADFSYLIFVMLYFSALISTVLSASFTVPFITVVKKLINWLVNFFRSVTINSTITIVTSIHVLVPLVFFDILFGYHWLIPIIYAWNAYLIHLIKNSIHNREVKTFYFYIQIFRTHCICYTVISILSFIVLVKSGCGFIFFQPLFIWDPQIWREGAFNPIRLVDHYTSLKLVVKLGLNQKLPQELADEIWESVRQDIANERANWRRSNPGYIMLFHSKRDAPYV